MYLLDYIIKREGVSGSSLLLQSDMVQDEQQPLVYSSFVVIGEEQGALVTL